MKILLALAMAATALLAFPAAEAQAGNSYRSKVLHRCNHCQKNVYAFYRPTRYIGTRAVYSWVPSYHSSCGRTATVRRNYGSTFRYSFGTPNYHNYGYSSGYRYRNIPSIRTHRSYPSYRGRSYSYGRCR